MEPERSRVRPRKSLGQHFLHDPGALARIVATAELSPSDNVLEIGPGTGNLTRLLAEQAGRVVAVELDVSLITRLQATFQESPHVKIVQGDILKLDPASLMEGSEYKIVANLPYYITSAILRHFLGARCPPNILVLTVQHEVAQRMVACPPQMSLLAVSVQFYSVPRLIGTIAAGAFYPPPKVTSAIVRLDRRPEPAVAVHTESFFQVAAAGFSQRRKQLHNSLAAGFHLPKAIVADALHAAGIDPKRRAETLTLEDWGRLAQSLPQR